MIWLAVLLPLASAPAIDVSGFGPKTDRRPFAIQSVTFRDRFWSPRLETNRTETIWHEIRQCELTPRLQNFEAAQGKPGTQFGGLIFDDSDVYKIIEAAGYLLMSKRDARLEARIDAIIADIAKAQEPDGYLCTQVTASKFTTSPMKRWDEGGGEHELYNVGHLYEGAVAYFMATGKRQLLDVALKSADLVCATFREGGRRHAPGHQEIELGLVKLTQLTGNAKYLRQAKWFLDERGNKSRSHLFGEYSQDHIPVVEQDHAVGHSVRAAYMYSAMLDVGTWLGDPRYVNASRTIWGDVVHSKIYVTGGIGSSGSNEGFAGGHNLPNLSGYAETCASIANVLWNQRLFMVDGDAKYVDVLERSLYNATLSGYGLDGKLFFYPNPLTSISGAERTPWFACACCPPNVARIVPMVASMMGATDARGVYLNLYAASTIQTKVGTRPVRLDVDTAYPWDGRVTVKVGTPGKMALRLRVPGWATGTPIASDLYLASAPKGRVRVKVNGKGAAVAPAKGFITLDRTWKKGDTVQLDLPMEPLWLTSNPAVKDNVGRRAMQRGPIVYCAEFTDQIDGSVLNRVIDPTEPVTPQMRASLGGHVALRTAAFVAERGDDGKPLAGAKAEFTMIPYYAWAHRGRGQMAVWLASDSQVAWPKPAPTLASTARVTASSPARTAPMIDQLEPSASNDHGVPFGHWWPNKGTTEWVQFDLNGSAKVSSVSVYWFEDEGIGECRLPTTWRVYVRQQGKWVPVERKNPGPVTKNGFDRFEFDGVETDAVKIEIDLAKGWATGIHEVVIR